MRFVYTWSSLKRLIDDVDLGRNEMNENVNANEQRRVFILDDHPILRRGLVEIIKQQAGLVVCRSALMAPQKNCVIKVLMTAASVPFGRH